MPVLRLHPGAPPSDREARDGADGPDSDDSSLRDAATIDWRTAAAALAEESAQPLVMLDVDNCVRVYNQAAAIMLGWEKQSLAGKPLTALLRGLRGDQIAWELDRLWRGETATLVALTLDRPGGARKVTLQFRAVGTAGGRALLGRIVDIQLLPEAPRNDQPALREALLLVARGGGNAHTIRSLIVGREELPVVGEPCHRALHGRDIPCPDCPLDQPGEGPVASVVAVEGRGPFWLVTREHGGTTALVRERPISDGEIGALVKARLTRLAKNSQLTEREQVVLELLVLGRTLEDVGIALDITVHTVKYHQANILKKIGADSRLDIIRLIL